jgi:simple sugar transport system substrate-binding protein/basic membrane protein A
MTVGYHADASELAPEGWLTGSEWDWGPLYTQIVEAVQAGEFVDSDFNGNFRVGLQTGDNPFVQSAFGTLVTEETQATIAEAEQAIIDGQGVFTGPITNQEGEEVVAEGETLTYDQAETMDFFVDGVTGTIES